MTPAEFAREIVVPTLEDFRADRTSRRWAYLSAIAVYHLRDYLAEVLVTLTGDPKKDRRAVEAEATKVDDAVRMALPDGAFDIVEGVANGSKHGLTRRLHAIPFTAGSDRERPEVLYGKGDYGVGVYGGVGGREIAHGDAQLDLYVATAATFRAFVAVFPAQLGGIAFDPYPEAQLPAQG